MSTHNTATTLSEPTKFLPVLAEMLVHDIPPEKFADRLGTTINHPAFVLGHCAYYAGVCITMLGGTVEFGEHESELFDMNAECDDESDRYPAKDECMAHFTSRCNEAADYLASCDPLILAGSTDGTSFEGRFSTLGHVAAFMLIGHPSFHLGQISAWRRVAGMGSAT
ncbi:MAG: hypothetical protein HOO04_07490 [Phycisphaerae bacterium]|nr:hypothetical protein [Phycisphaerae bacterium]MBT5383132.1 hypothetical protein [Phycisphaerae bacterium]MBT5582677.1 hypothetical protein [Phycisphaerae bacterium]MBT5657529.1 hypothetical protein [Phycisphaerae bacterium]